MPDDKPCENVNQDGIQQSPKGNTAHTPPPPNYPPIPGAQPVSSQDMQREVHDIEDRVKRAERWMIYLTAAIALFALGSVVVGVLQWAAMRGQLRAAIDADKLTRDAMIVSQRPWLGMESAVIVKRYPTSWAIKWSVKNYGNSPSLHSVVVTDFAGGMDTAPQMREHLGDPVEFACKTAEVLTTSSHPKIPEEHGYTVFPGSSISPQLQTTGSPTKPLTWVGCITYLDQFADTKRAQVHHTRFCYNFTVPLVEGEIPAPCFARQGAD